MLKVVDSQTYAEAVKALFDRKRQNRLHEPEGDVVLDYYVEPQLGQLLSGRIKDDSRHYFSVSWVLNFETMPNDPTIARAYQMELAYFALNLTKIRDDFAHAQEKAYEEGYQSLVQSKGEIKIMDEQVAAIREYIKQAHLDYSAASERLPLVEREWPITQPAHDLFVDMINGRLRSGGGMAMLKLVASFYDGRYYSYSLGRCLVPLDLGNIRIARQIVNIMIDDRLNSGRTREASDLRYLGKYILETKAIPRCKENEEKLGAD